MASETDKDQLVEMFLQCPFTETCMTFVSPMKEIDGTMIFIVGNSEVKYEVRYTMEEV